MIWGFVFVRISAASVIPDSTCPPVPSAQSRKSSISVGINFKPLHIRSLHAPSTDSKDPRVTFRLFTKPQIECIISFK